MLQPDPVRDTLESAILAAATAYMTTAPDPPVLHVALFDVDGRVPPRASLTRALLRRCAPRALRLTRVNHQAETDFTRWQAVHLCTSKLLPACVVRAPLEPCLAPNSVHVSACVDTAGRVHTPLSCLRQTPGAVHVSQLEPSDATARLVRRIAYTDLVTQLRQRAAELHVQHGVLLLVTPLAPLRVAWLDPLRAALQAVGGDEAVRRCACPLVAHSEEQLREAVRATGFLVVNHLEVVVGGESQAAREVVRALMWEELQSASDGRAEQVLESLRASVAQAPPSQAYAVMLLARRIHTP